MTGLPPARSLRSRETIRLLHIDPKSAQLRDHMLTELPSLLRRDDLIVLNDAATLPASLLARTPGGERLELRLLEAPNEEGLAWAVLYASGSWRNRTEDRVGPSSLAIGTRLRLLDSELALEIIERSESSERLVLLLFGGSREEVLGAVYRSGRPIQYSYLDEALPLWAFQTPFAARPWAVEPPSAGLMLSHGLLDELRARGVSVATLTHGAGISSTGDPKIDERLPLSERYEIPESTVDAVRRAKIAGGRVLAAGTTVLRALEGAWQRGRGTLAAGAGRTALRVGPDTRLGVVDALLTGMHVPGESHFDILRALVPESLLERAQLHASGAGYVAHELGDCSLILA